jgi:hypothetical protein
MEAANAKIETTPNRGYRLLCVALAFVLLAASALKCHQLATEPILGTSLLDSRWLLIVTVEFELFLGLWLPANCFARATWVVALACFGLFTCVSLYKALSGYASCGCFGAVQVNPWHMTGLDAAIVVSLLHWRPRQVPSPFGKGADGEGWNGLFARPIHVLAVWLLLGLPAAYAMGSYTDTTLSDVGEIIGDGRIVVLEPEKWIGKRFPLLSYIDIGDTLKDGEWLVLLYRYDCPKCRTAIQDLPRTIRTFGVRQIALVEMPPYGDVQEVPEIDVFSLLTGRLNDSKRWFVQAPVTIVLHNGFVEE